MTINYNSVYDKLQFGGDTTDDGTIDANSAITILNSHKYVGILKDAPEHPLDVVGVIRTSSHIIAGSATQTSSDRRIKKDIKELNDKECLDKLLLLKPCKYKYKDVISRGEKETYGFIAQEVEEIMPEAVKTNDHFIPNIYKIGKYNDKIITLNETTEYTPVQGDMIKIYDKYNVITETVILDVYSDVSFRIEDEILTEYVFIYGSKIDNFKTLIKDMFHPICVSSIQDHNKIINEQQAEINALKEKLNTVMNHLNLI